MELNTRCRSKVREYFNKAFHHTEMAHNLALISPKELDVVQECQVLVMMYDDLVTCISQTTSQLNSKQRENIELEETLKKAIARLESDIHAVDQELALRRGCIESLDDRAAELRKGQARQEASERQYRSQANIWEEIRHENSVVS